MKYLVLRIRILQHLEENLVNQVILISLVLQLNQQDPAIPASQVSLATQANLQDQAILANLISRVTQANPATLENQMNLSNQDLLLKLATQDKLKDLVQLHR